MLRDGQIVYGARESPLFRWEFGSTALNGVVIAILTTILSYEVAASLFDIFLGFKEKGRARASDIHMLLLSQKSSPLAVVNSLMRKDCITRRHFLGNIPAGSEILREKERVRITVCTKLLFLLCVAPAVNIISIAFTLEQEKILTFRDLNFGGLALGVSTDLTLASSEKISPTCQRSRLKTTPGEKPYPTFSTCHSWTVDFADDIDGIVALAVVISTKAYIQTALFWGNESSLGTKEGLVVLDGAVYYMEHAIGYGDVVRLADFGMRLLLDELRIENAEVSESLTGSEGSFGDDALTLIRLINYSPRNTSPEIVRRIHKKLLEHVTFVNSESLKLQCPEGFNDNVPQNFSSADDLNLLNRRRRNLSLPLLGIVTLCAVVVRLIVKVIFNNDLNNGLEEIIKEQTGIEELESIFQGGKRTLYYNKKYQEGNYAQYGLVRNDMPEVQEFVGGCIGLEKDPAELD